MSGFIHERTAEQIAVDAEVLARVKRGIARLEERYGPTWVDHMRLSDLDLSNASRCVLGQVYGNYWEACERLSLEPEQGSARFEETVSCGFVEPDDRDYDLLQTVWERELTALGVAR